ncbi:adenosylcobinamide-GDP ribazoletransferase, partial [Xanthomonas euvesicatoria]
GLVGSSRAGLLLSLLLGLACAFAVGRLRGMLACAVTGVVLVMWRRACLQRLGGMTGDTCGALVEISETAVLVALALQAS